MPSPLTTDPEKIFFRTGDQSNAIRYWVIGDSHSLFFAGLDMLTKDGVVAHGAHTGYGVYYVGPGLAGSLMKPVSRNRTHDKIVMALDAIDAAETSRTIIFSFGEIDCRFRIRERAQMNGDDSQAGLQQSADVSIGNYMAFLRKIAKRGFTPIIWGPPPSTTTPPHAHDWLTLGSMEERNQLTRYFNQRLREEAATHNIVHVSLFDDLVEGDRTRPDFSHDTIHIAQTYWPVWLEKAHSAGLHP